MNHYYSLVYLCIFILSYQGCDCVIKSSQVIARSFSSSIDDIAADCYAFKSCSPCIDSQITNGLGFGCGWCKSTNACYNQTSKGEPSNQKCNLWYTDDCSDEDLCLDKQSCGECTANNTISSNLFCGWCDEQKCVPGNKTGPGAGISCQQWSYSSQTCPVNCTAYVECNSCTAFPECGWCGDGSGCHRGGEAGPSDSTNCTLWSWQKCNDDPLDCSSHSSCDTCVKDPSDRCGWCATTNQCVTVTNGTSDTPCTILKLKTCRDACVDFQTCSECNKNNCGWCNDQCLAGNENGPQYTNCSRNWNFGNCSVECHIIKDCASCIGSSGCGWCSTDKPDSSSCLPSTQLPACNGRFSTQTCPSIGYECSSFSNCQLCTSYGCMWCPSSGCYDYEASLSLSCSAECETGGHGGLEKGEIAGIVVAIIVVVGAIGFVIWHRVYWTKRHYYEVLR